MGGLKLNLECKIYSRGKINLEGVKYIRREGIRYIRDVKYIRGCKTCGGWLK